MNTIAATTPSREPLPAIMKKILLLVLVLLLSCNNQDKKNNSFRGIKSKKELAKTENKPSQFDTTLEKAKWYFYAFASTEKIYTHSQIIVSAIECEIKTNSVKQISRDTTKVFFTFFYKDTLDQCWSSPYGLGGITIIKQQLYVPIYHVVEFDYFKKESLVRGNMKKQEENLLKIIKANKSKLSDWLKTYISHSKNS